MSKVEAVSTFPVPKTKKDVRSFLGLTGYYRKFMPQYATIATPLTDLTQKTGPICVKWTPECSIQEVEGTVVFSSSTTCT